MRVLVTGRPGVGKTTLVKRLSERVPACGFYTEEVREKGKRVGFDGVRIGTGERVPLARTGWDGPRVGRYGVNLRGVERLVEWLRVCGGIVFVDEIGPMELKHPSFSPVVLEAARRAEAFLGTVHRSLADRWRRMLDAELIYLTEENRERVLQELLSYFSRVTR